MTLSAQKKTGGPIPTALVAAAREAIQMPKHPAAVSIWVIWTRARQTIICESVTRLDVDIPVMLPVDADEVVVVAVAPTRVAGPVIGRVDVIYDYLAGKGFTPHAVHAYALEEGALWTSLRGNAIGGILPSLTAPPTCPPRRHGWLPRLGTRAGNGYRLLPSEGGPIQ